jgi:SAM-dependent methyltransferase
MEEEYYYLQEGDMIQEGDQIQLDNGMWNVAVNCVGEAAPNPLFTSHRQYRRPLANFPERKMAEAKEDNTDIEKNGYEEEVFGDDYWLYSDGKSPARINKSALQLIKYFDDIFKSTLLKVNPKGVFRIGDIGAGAGSMVKQFHDAGFKAEGCEYSESGKRISKERFGIELGHCDLRGVLPYEDDYFDWTYCVGVLSMIPEKDMTNALKEILRVTRYGALINAGTTIGYNRVDRIGNPHHLTPIIPSKMWQRINEIGLDWTSILPPQKQKYGIGVANEFAGLFGKNPWPFGGKAK